MDLDGGRDRLPLTGDVVEDSTIAAGSFWSGVVREGQRLRIIDLEGTQAVDFLCYNAQDYSERYNAPNTMKLSESVFVSQGARLLSSLARPMFTVVEDTCGGHDTIGGCCSAPSNELLYGTSGTGNCRDNLLAALAQFGLGARDLVPNINWFMRVLVEADGRLGIVDGESKAGDFVDLQADMDVVAALSNCPQVLNPANGFHPTSIRVVICQPSL